MEIIFWAGLQQVDNTPREFSPSSEVLQWFEWECPLQTMVFEHRVPRWWSWLGEDLVWPYWRKYVSGGDFESLKTSTTSSSFSLLSACDWHIRSPLLYPAACCHNSCRDELPSLWDCQAQISSFFCRWLYCSDRKVMNSMAGSSGHRSSGFTFPDHFFLPMTSSSSVWTTNTPVTFIYVKRFLL